MLHAQGAWSMAPQQVTGASAIGLANENMGEE